MPNPTLITGPNDAAPSSARTWTVQSAIQLLVALVSLGGAIVITTLFISDRPTESRVESMIDRTVAPMQSTLNELRNEIKEQRIEMRKQNEWLRDNIPKHSPQ